MASLEKRSETFHVIFRYLGAKYTRSLKTNDEKTAKTWKACIEETLRDIRRGKVASPPEGCDPAEYILAGGKVTQRKADQCSEALSLGDLFAKYFSALPNGSREISTINGMKIHRDHLYRILGKTFIVQSLRLGDLQRFVNRRARDTGLRGRKVTGSTIRKALVTFQTVWKWGSRMGYLTGDFPNLKDVDFPKDHDSAPFQSHAEITGQIQRGGAARLMGSTLSSPERNRSGASVD